MELYLQYLLFSYTDLCYNQTMKKLGIIAEYNPFHEGHKYLIEEAKKKTGAEQVIAVMSGNFTQRGYPAIYDKWSRTECAIKNGVNLVLELPVCYACNSAEYFAKGGVEVMEGLGCVDYLAFGSESGNIKGLLQAATALKENESKIIKIVQEKTKKGLSYPKAREAAVMELRLEENLSLIREPNNILGIEYLKQINTLEPVTLKRIGAGHHQSASEIRKVMREKEGERIESLERNYYRLVAGRILQMSPDELDKVFSSGEGLGNKLKQEIRYAHDFEELVERIKSKAYTRTRITRLLTHIVLGINEEVMRKAVPYIRILGFDCTGAIILKEMKKKKCANLPVLTNINKEKENYPEIETTLEKDILAADLYNLISDRDLYIYSDYVKRPIIL